jgi:hypothetical protein
MHGTAMKRTMIAGLTAAAASAALLAAPSPAQAAGGHIYGSIAISPATGNTAYAVNYPNAAAAHRAAEAKCGAADCQWVVQLDRNCGAVTQQPHTLRWGWAYAPHKRAAERAAANKSGPGSRTVIWACTDGWRR